MIADLTLTLADEESELVTNERARKGNKMSNLFSSDFFSTRDIFLNLFESSRVDIGKKGFRFSTQIRDLVKKGIEVLKSGNRDEIGGIRQKISDAWTELIDARIPSDLAWRHEAEAAQELWEFEFVVAMYDYLFDGAALDFKKFDIYPPDEDGDEDSEEYREKQARNDYMCSFTPQQWLAGLIDAPTELGKVLEDYCIDNDLSPSAYVELWDKYVKIVEQVVNFLSPFENVYGQVINNSRMRGFANTFRGRYGRLRGFLERKKRDLMILRLQMKIGL